MDLLPSVSSLEFEEIKASIKTYLKTKTDFKDYDYEGSNLSMLIDVLAYNTLYSSYNINMAANELNLDTAVLRDNVVSHAKRLGYNPSSYTSSKIYTNISVNLTDVENQTPETLTLSAGAVLSAVSDDGNLVTFVNRNPITLNVVNQETAVFEELELIEGSEFSISYTVDYSNENQRFIIPNNYIDADTIKVFVNSSITGDDTGTDIEYTRKTTIVDVSAADKIFFVEEIQDQQYEIIFGDNVIGRKLEDGEIITIKYIISSGQLGNNITESGLDFIGSIFVNDDIIIGIQNVTTTILSPSGGGSEFEDIKTIKYRAPRYYAAQQRAVTTSDYESIVQTIYSNTDFIKVTGGEDLVPPQYGKVYISIKPKIGDIISLSEKKRIVNELKKYVVGSITPVIADSEPFYILVSPTIVYDPSKTTKNLSAINSSIEEKFKEFNSSTDFRSFNGLFSSSKLISLLEGIDSSIKFVTLNTIFRKPIKLFGNINYIYETEFYTNLNNKIPGKYTLISDPFCIKGINVPVILVSYAFNYGYCDDAINQSIFISTIQGRIIANVGQIDYTTGKIRFTIVPCDDSEINIHVIPQSPDITTGTDVYPVLIQNETKLIDYSTLNVTSFIPSNEVTTKLITDASQLDCRACGTNPNIPGTTVKNPDGSTTVTDNTGTTTTVLPDGTTIVELPVEPVIPVEPDITNPTLDDFTPESPDTCK